MTISVSTNRIVYDTVDGVQTVFEFPFIAYNTDAIKITFGPDDEQTVGFVVALEPDFVGGSVTFTVAPDPSVGTLTIQRIEELTQEVDLVPYDKFPSEVIERVFDKLTMICQQLQDNVGRAMVSPVNDPLGTVLIIPELNARLGRVLAFDPITGNPIASNFTLEELEQAQATAAAAVLAAQAAELASENSATASTAAKDISVAKASEATAAATLAQEWAENPEDDPVMPGKFSALHWAAKAAANVAWAAQPIGVPIPIWTHIAGVSVPPTDNASYRYIKLTASDSYNTGVLASETVSGSAPLVQATAVISDSGSPLNGQTVRLINTESRFLRAGPSGTLQDYDTASHNHSIAVGAYSGTPGTYATWVHGGFTNDNSFTYFSGAVQFVGGTETRPTNIGATYYMRIR